MKSRADDDSEKSDLNASYHYFSEDDPSSIKYKKGPVMTNLWSIIIFILNVWMIFFAIFWASVDTHPDGGQLFVAILFEWILFIEVLIRIVIRIFFRNSYKNLNLLHVEKNDGFWVFTILMISSFPILSLNIICSGTDSDKSNNVISYLLLLKVLRCFEIHRVLHRLEEILFYKKFKTLLLVKSVMNFLYILLITHVSTCSWLFVSQITTVGIAISTGNPHNPFNANLPYFKRMGLEDAPLYQKYIDSLEWAVSTLTGCSYGDVSPRIVQEIIVSLIVFLIGMLLLAKVFSDFSSLLYLLDIEKEHAKKKLDKALNLCKILDIPESIQGKIKAFYLLDKEGYPQTHYLSAVQTLPKSLNMGILLCINRELINKTNLFNFESPSFVVSVVKCLYPKISMAGDFIVKVGEFAEEMYFIKSGEVEVLATDNKTRIAILREGAYFGEIGLLLTGKRTVTVRALGFCVFQAIDKDNFNHLMDMYPEQKGYLKKIGKQRSETSRPEDLDIQNLESLTLQHGIAQKNSVLIINQDPNSQIKQSKFKQSVKKLKEKFIIRWKHWVSTENDIFHKKDDNCIIIPMSRFYLFWAFMMGTVVFYNCSIVTYGIFFHPPTQGDHPGLWYTLDVLSVVIYFLDIFVHMNTAVKTGTSYITDASYVHQKYINESLAIDFLAFLPIDYIMLALGVPMIYISWVKILRLIKIPRFVSVLLEINRNISKKNTFSLFILAIFFVLLNHLAACLMHAIAEYEYMKGHYYLKTDLFQVVSQNNRVNSPLADQSDYVQYASFIYWAFQTSSSGAYGDISGVAPFEKVFQVICLLLFRIFFAFIAAKAADILKRRYSSYAKKQEQKKIYEEWMKHANLPRSVVSRVRRFINHTLDKHYGLKKNKILNGLPSTTKYEIFEFLLKDAFDKTQVFPKEQAGLRSDAVKCVRLVDITKDEYVFKAGEIADGLYFILEGKIRLFNPDENMTIADLQRNDVFGEAGLLQEERNMRTRSAKALTDVLLAEISLQDLNKIWDKYPVVQRNIIEIAKQRRRSSGEESIPSNQNSQILKEIEFIQSPEKKEIVPNSQIASPISISKLGTFSPQKNQNSIEMTQLQSESFYPNKEDIRLSPSKGLKLQRQRSNKPPENPRKITKNPSDWEFSAIPESPSKSISEDFQEIANHLEIQTEQNIDINEQKDQNNNKNSQFDKNITEKDLSQIEISKDPSLLEMKTTTEKIDHRPHGFCPFILWFLKALTIKYKGYRAVISNLVLLVNLFFIPLDLALNSVRYKGILAALEVVIILIFFFNFVLSLQEYITVVKKNQQLPEGRTEVQRKEKKYNKRTPFNLALDFLYIIPFGWIFEAADIEARRTNIFLILLQLIRFSYLKRIMWIFHLEWFKKRYALGNILAILFAFIIMNHVFACLFIMLVYSKDDFNDTWLAKIPAPQFSYPNNVRTVLDANESTIYISALYWSYVTTSHIGVGDVVGINVTEKFYSSFVIAVSTFLYAFLFGNLALMVDSLTPKFRKVFTDNYKKVITYVKTSSLENFLPRIHEYYSYQWTNNIGIDEDRLLDKLPISIKYDVVFLRYHIPIVNSRFFMDSSNKFDYRIFYIFCRKYRCQIFLKNQYIIASGQQTSDVYFILDGEAEIVKYIAPRSTTKLYPGNYFGGIVPGIVQPQSIRTTKITKVAVLNENSFNELKAAHPEWFAYLLKFEKIHEILMRFVTRIKNRLQAKKKEVIPLDEFAAPYPHTKSKQNSIRKMSVAAFLHPRKTKSSSSSLKLKYQPKSNPGFSKYQLIKRTQNESYSSKTKGLTDEHLNEPSQKKHSEMHSQSLYLKDQPKLRAASDKGEHTEQEKDNINDLSFSKRSKTTPPIEIKNFKPSQNDFGYSSKFALQRNIHPINNRRDIEDQIPVHFQKMLIYRPDRKLPSRLVTDEIKDFGFHIHPESNWKMLYEFIHLVMIMYSIFAVPIYVGFSLEASTAFIILEVICLVEQIVYLILQARTPQYINGKLTLDSKTTYTRLKENGLFVELIAMIPLNLILGTIGVKEPAWLIGILRMNRVLLILRLPSQLTIFELKWIKLTSYLKIFRPIFYLAFIWNFTSCLWAWFLTFGIEKQYVLTWYIVLNLDQAALWQQYLFSLEFTMNIATTTGYPEMIIYNNYERCLFIVFVYFGDAFFGLAFAWFVAVSSTFPEKYNYVFTKIRKMNYILQKGRISSKLRNKLEKYFAYIVETRNQNKSCLEVLSGLLPLSMLKDLAYSQARSLYSIPLFVEYRREKLFLNEIVYHLRPSIYLPEDYITSRNDSGTEMYIIEEGTVFMFSPNGKKALCSLQAGSYFGELGLYTTTKRLTSFGAVTFCLIYIFDQKMLKDVLNKFPHLQFDFKLFLHKRKEICTVEGATYKEKLKHAYMTLSYASKHNQKIITQKCEIDKLLRVSEIPKSIRLRKKHVNEEEHKEYRSNERKSEENKTEGILLEERKETEEETISIDSTLDGYVDDEEIEYKDIDTKKNTFRVKTRVKDRRYSRINIGKEKNVSKSEGLTLKWDINME